MICSEKKKTGATFSITVLGSSSTSMLEIKIFNFVELLMVIWKWQILDNNYDSLEILYSTKCTISREIIFFDPLIYPLQNIFQSIHFHTFLILSRKLCVYITVKKNIEIKFTSFIRVCRDAREEQILMFQVQWLFCKKKLVLPSNSVRKKTGYRCSWNEWRVNRNRRNYI